MRSYHKHGAFGSHNISTTHKTKAANKTHNTEIMNYGKKHTKNYKPIPKLPTTIELPIDKDGTIICNLLTLKKSLFVKTKTDSGKDFEMRFN